MIHLLKRLVSLISPLCFLPNRETILLAPSKAKFASRRYPLNTKEEKTRKQRQTKNTRINLSPSFFFSLAWENICWIEVFWCRLKRRLQLSINPQFPGQLLRAVRPVNTIRFSRLTSPGLGALFPPPGCCFEAPQSRTNGHHSSAIVKKGQTKRAQFPATIVKIKYRK